MNEMYNAFMRFKNNFSGDAKEEVMRLVRTGRMTQQQLDKLQQMATRFQKMMKI